MFDINKIKDALYMVDYDTSACYDAQNEEIILIDENILNYYEEDEDVIDSLPQDIKDKLDKYDQIFSNHKRFFLLPSVFELNKDTILKEFVNTIEDKEFVKLFKKTKSLKKHLDLLKEYSLTDNYIKFLDDAFLQIAKQWAYENDLLNEEIDINDYTQCHNLAKEFAKENIWKNFKDADFFKITYLGEEYYYSILGKFDNCYGVEIFYDDEGLNQLLLEKEIVSFDQSSLLAMAIKNNDVIHLQPYDELIPMDRELVSQIEEEITDELYPSFISFKEGLVPYPILNNMRLKRQIPALKALILFAKEYNKKPRKIPKNEEIHYNISIDQNDKVVYRKIREFDCIPSFEYPQELENEIEEFRKNIKPINGVMQFDIKALFMGVEEDGIRYFSYLPIFYDVNNNKILSAKAITSKTGLYIADICKVIMKEFSKLKIAKTIECQNPYSHQLMLFLFGDKVKIMPSNKEFDVIDDFTAGLDDFIRNGNLKEELIS